MLSVASFSILPAYDSTKLTTRPIWLSHEIASSRDSTNPTYYEGVDVAVVFVMYYPMNSSRMCQELTCAVMRDLWIFDIGGTLLKSIDTPEAFSDALKLYRVLRACGKKTALYTNICLMSVPEVAEVMKGAGFEITQDYVFTGSSMTAEYISSEKNGARCFAIGEASLYEDLGSHGVEIAVNPPVDFVVIGVDRGLTLRELAYAAQLVKDGARLLYIDPRPLCRTMYLGSEDITLGPRALAAAIEFSTGVRAETACKPSPESFLRLVGKTPFSPENTVMVGNLLETDIAGANAAGILSILIDRPTTTCINESYKRLITPDITLDSLEELLEPLEKYRIERGN